MAYLCDNCGRTVNRANLVSHAKNRVKRVMKPNLHSVYVMVKGKKVKQRLCTRCLRRADRPKREKKVEKSGGD